ncbi:MAG: hypothetical protein WAM90_08815 [Rhodanobacter sp.]
MYVSLNTTTDTAPKAWRVPSDPNAIWFGVMGNVSISATLAETQQLITELQREVAAEEARVRSVAA